MGPNGVGESSSGSGQGQPPVGVMEPSVTTTQINPNSVPNPLSGLEDAINAAKKALGQTESPAPQATASESVTEPAVPQSPTEQFQNTFGDAIPQASPAPSEAVLSVPVEPIQAPVAEFSSIPTEAVSPIQSAENTVQESATGPVPQVPEAQPQTEVELPPNVQKFLDSVLNAANEYREAEKTKTTSS